MVHNGKASVSLIIEETNIRVSGGHVILICKCHECGDFFKIQRRRFLSSKPCGLCVRKKQNAWNPMFEKIEKLKEENEKMRDILKFIFNPYSAPEETIRRLQERYWEVDEILNKPLTET
jgi:hypothetical protein